MDKHFGRLLKRYRRTTFGDITLMAAAVALNVVYGIVHPPALQYLIQQRRNRR